MKTTKKKSFKRLFAFLMAFVMVTALAANAVFAAGSFTDVSEGDDFYENIESLYEQGIIGGFADGTFRPGDYLTRQQAAKMIALGANYGDHDGTGSKLVDVADLTWGQENIWALEAAGVVKGFGTSKEFRPRLNITRGHVAKMIALAFGLEEGDVEVDLIDLPADEEVADAIRILASNGIVSGFGKSKEFRPDALVTRGQFAKMVDLAMEAVQLKVVSVSAINAKTLEVKFNNAVAEEDQAGVTFDVKRGSFATSVTPTWAEDGKSVELARTINLIAGDYTVTVAGLEFAEGANVGTVKVEAQKIASLEIETANVIKDANAKVVYNAKDQYGDKMDVAVDQFTWVVVNTTDASRTVATVNAASTTDKVLEIDTNTNAKVDDVLRVTGLLNSDPSVKAVKEITVSNVFIENFELENVVLPEGETRLNQATGVQTIELEYSAVDNYGKEMTLPTKATGTTANVGDITFVSSKDALIDAKSVAVDAKGKLTFVVKAGQSGKATITALNNNTGETSSVLVEVFATATATKVQFGDFKDGLPLIAGEAANTAKLEVTFFDQYGEAMKPANVTGALSNFNITVTGAGTLGNPSLSSDGKYLQFPENLATKGTYTLSLVNKTTGDVASTQIVVNEARVPAELKVKKSPDASVANGKTTNVVFEVKDQYGKDFAGATITQTVTGSNATASVSGYTGTITGAASPAAGKETIKFELSDGTKIVDSKVFEVEVVAVLNSLDVTVDKTEYTAGDDIAVTIKAESAVGTVHTKYNKTEVATIKVGSSGNEKTYLRTVTFVNGIATTTVPATEANANVIVNATVEGKTDALAIPDVKVVAGAASKLALDTANVYVADKFGNKADYDFAGIAKVTNVAGTLTNVTPDAEGNVQVKIVDGDVFASDGTTKVTFAAKVATVGATLTLELTNGDVFTVVIPKA